MCDALWTLPWSPTSTPTEIPFGLTVTSGDFQCISEHPMWIAVGVSNVIPANGGVSVSTQAICAGRSSCFVALAIVSHVYDRRL